MLSPVTQPIIHLSNVDIWPDVGQVQAFMPPTFYENFSPAELLLIVLSFLFKNRQIQQNSKAVLAAIELITL